MGMHLWNIRIVSLNSFLGVVTSLATTGVQSRMLVFGQMANTEVGTKYATEVFCTLSKGSHVEVLLVLSEASTLTGE